jgi:hypothetical protein
VDSNGSPFQAVYREPSIAGGVFITPSAFVSDRLRVSERITVDAGVRFDHSRAINPELPIVSADGRETDAAIPGVGTLYTQNVVSPRLGLTANLDAKGRTVLRASYGRFYQGVLSGELDPVSQGTTPTRTMAYEAATGGYTRLISVVDPKTNLALDPNTRSPRTDEFSLALDREITPRVRASVAYVHKRGRDFIGWLDRGGRYREEVRTIGGVTVPVLALTNATADRRFFLTNPDGLFANYDGLVAAVETPRSDKWYVTGSYTYSRAHGLQVMSGGAPEDPQFSTIARPSFLTFGQDPNDLTNATGRLPNDRPHVFRASAVARLPWQGFQVAANLQAFSGKPWAATTQVTLPQGSRRILLEPRGTRRLSSQTLLDLRVSKSLSMGAAARKLDLILDILNVLGDSAEEALVSDNLVSETFGRPRLYLDPRRAMLGVRLNLGR